jgi:hypothetical protein
MIVSSKIKGAYIDNEGVLHLPEGYERVPENSFNRYMDATNKTTDLIIPEGIKRIDDFAFCNMSFDHVYIPDGVIEIGPSAFEQCSIKHLYLPNSLKHIRCGAFQYVINLKDIVLPKGLEFIGNNAFARSDVELLILSSTIKIIQPYAFLDCKNLHKVFMHKGCTPFSIKNIFGDKSNDAFCVMLIN